MELFVQSEKLSKQNTTIRKLRIVEGKEDGRKWKQNVNGKLYFIPSIVNTVISG